MWPWQQKGRNKKEILLKIFCITAVFHLIILFNLFFIYNNDEHSFTFKSGDIARLDQAKIVVMPFGKKRKSVEKLPVVSGIQRLPISDTVPTPITEKKEIHVPTVAQREVAKAATTLTVQKAPQLKKKKKQALKKQKKRIKDQKKSKKENISKKEKIEPKKEQTPEAKKMVTEQLQKPKEEQTIKTNDSVVPTMEPAAPSEPVYVTQQELEDLLLYDDLKSELESVWKPPVGISDIQCQVRIALSWEGVVEQTIVEASSGVLVFDMAARQAVAAMKFPKQLWGKHLSITFT